MATVIFFRGRNTGNIIADAKAFGVLTETDDVVIVARKGDALAEEGDVTEVLPQTAGELTIVANGGTTAQLAPYLFNLGFAAGGDVARRYDERIYDAYDPNPRLHLKVLDLQRDGVTVLVAASV